jgi:hypothetical protein
MNDIPGIKEHSKITSLLTITHSLHGYTLNLTASHLKIFHLIQPPPFLDQIHIGSLSIPRVTSDIRAGNPRTSTMPPDTKAADFKRIENIAHVRCRDDRPSPPIIRCGMSIYCAKYGETRNSLSLSGEKWCESRHLVFWSLGTLTSLRDWVRKLVA